VFIPVLYVIMSRVLRRGGDASDKPEHVEA
jgi:hypothetical protein